MPNRVGEEVHTPRRISSAEYDKAEEKIGLSSLEAFRELVPDSVLEKLSAAANQGLILR